jgi:hypothetical protein
MTSEPWSRPRPPQWPLTVSIAALVVSVPLAVVFLVLGLFGPLVWVYLSIATSVAWVPLGVAVAVTAVRRNRHDQSLVFLVPPGWPATPPDWMPYPGWQPDPEWPAAPEDWKWWA